MNKHVENKKSKENSDAGIDFVITWVDGSDENWRREKALYSGRSDDDDRPERYRDWDMLKYWFRGVDNYAPWVRKIHFITWGHLPNWLDTSNPKINIVRHEDFIPKEYLPTFNSNVIEFHMHKIKDLSDRFVYFNDDMYIVGAVGSDSFFKGDYPCDMLAFQPVVANVENPVMSHLFLNNTLLLAKYFDKRKNVKSQPEKYFKLSYPLKNLVYNFMELAFPRFTGFYTAHGPYPLNKSIFELAWEREYEQLHNTSMNKFRSSDDVSIYILREWKKLLGEFVPVNIEKNFKYFNVSSTNKELVNVLKKHKAKIICINDANSDIDFEYAKYEITNAFEEIFPLKSSFEL